MPAGRQTPWLVCYDIADPDRLRKVWKSVSRWATPFQYSVWKYSATRKQLNAQLSDINEIIDARDDDVRAYALLIGGRHAVYGDGRLPEGVMVDE